MPKSSSALFINLLFFQQIVNSFFTISSQCYCNFIKKHTFFVKNIKKMCKFDEKLSNYTYFANSSSR